MHEQGEHPPSLAHNGLTRNDDALILAFELRPQNSRVINSLINSDIHRYVHGTMRSHGLTVFNALLNICVYLRSSVDLILSSSML